MKSSMEHDVRETSALIVLHFYATGPGQELHAWLAERCGAAVTLLEHPFPFAPRACALVQHWQGGVRVAQRELPRRAWPVFVRYALDFLRTLRVAIGARRRFDTYVGNGAFDTLPGIILRWLGRVRRVVLYTIDYAPGAGGSRVYACVYRMIDRWCCYHADAIWNLSRRMHAARVADGLNERRCAPVVWVPHGTHAAALRPLLPPQPDPARIVFMGHVQEKSGVQLLVEILPRLAQRHPSAHLDVVGGGPYLAALAQQAECAGVAERVTLHGYIDDHRALELLLMQCGIGVALYRPDPGDFSAYADPGKPKVYLACGLPVVMVNVPEVAEEIERRGAGRSISYDAGALERALDDIIAQHAAFRARACAMAADYEWDGIFARAWLETCRGRPR